MGSKWAGGGGRGGKKTSSSGEGRQNDMRSTDGERGEEGGGERVSEVWRRGVG